MAAPPNCQFPTGLNAPQYPLSREEFRRALSTGHGRVKLHVERFGAREFRDEILEAATVCKVYDPGCEGSREDWLADLCFAAGVQETVLAQSPSEDPSDRNQRAALLLQFAKRGVPGAREALYACWGQGHYSNFYATKEIVELDGDAGVLFVAREIGSLIQQDADLSISTVEFWEYDESRTEGAARALLANAADSDALIRTYLDEVELEEARVESWRGGRNDARRTIGEVLEAIRSNTEQYGAGWVRTWATRASRAELEVVLAELFSLTHPRAIEACLRCLGGSGLPPLLPLVFELTRHEDAEVRYWAARVLSKHSLPGVRAWGLESLARGDSYVALEILKRSAQVDDADAIVAAVRRDEDRNDQHGVCGGVLDILENCTEICDPRLALQVYEHTPCTNCREKSVEWLLEQRLCPPWVLGECASDADEGIRELAARARSPQSPPPAVS